MTKDTDETGGFLILDVLASMSLALAPHRVE